MTARLVNAYTGADTDARAQGVAWYTEARAKVRAMARTHGVTRACAAGVVAALSPRLQWAVNVRAAEVVLAGGVPSGVFKTSFHKAMRIYRGGERPLAVLAGPKTRAFYRALMGDDHSAVVDVWVLRAVGWTRSLTDKVYRRIAGALARAAALVGVPVATLQAVAWVVVRGRAA